MPWLMKQLKLRSSDGADGAAPTRTPGAAAAEPLEAQLLFQLNMCYFFTATHFPEWRSIFRVDSQVSHFFSLLLIPPSLLIPLRRPALYCLHQDQWPGYMRCLPWCDFCCTCTGPFYGLCTAGGLFYGGQFGHAVAFESPNINHSCQSLPCLYTCSCSPALFVLLNITFFHDYPFL